MTARAARTGASVLHAPRPVPPRTARAGTATPALRVVPTPAPRTGRASFIVLILLVLSGGLAALLGFNTALAQGSFTASELQKQATELEDRTQRLEEELARAAAPERLAKAARGIGMVPAPGVGFIGLEDGKVIGGAEPAPFVPPPLTPAQKAEQEAERKAQNKVEAEKAAAEKAARAEREALKKEQAAAAAAAAQAAAAEAAARAEWERKLAEQEKAGPRGGGEQLVEPPPGN